MRLKRNEVRTGNESDEKPEDVYFVLGGENVGNAIAQRLRAAGHSVRFVDETCDPAETPGVRGDPADIEVLKEAGVSDASTVVVTTSRDSRNLLIAQLVRTHFEVSDALVLVNDPDRYETIAGAGHEPTCATTALSDAVVDNLENTRHRVDYTA